MLADYMENMLNSWGFGNKDSSLKEKFAQHQKRHLDLISSYQQLCQDSYTAMLISTMKGDLKEMHNNHKTFLAGLNQTMESMFENNMELASHAPDKLGQVLNYHRESYENILSSFPQAKQIKGQIDNHYLTKGLRKLALGTVTAVLTAVAMPVVGKASEIFQPDTVHHQTMTGIQTIQTAQDQINQMLDTPFVESQALTAYRNSSYLVKDLTPKYPDPRANDPRYQGRSAIYGESNPKIPMIHAYYHQSIFPYLSAALPYANGPSDLEDYLSQNYPTYEKVYSFVAARLNDMGRNQLALKPQYMVHPNAPETYQGKEYWSEVDWTVIPGVEGQITPRGGELQKVGLLHDTIVTHPAEQKIGNSMNLSGDSMHLNGIDSFNKGLRYSSKDLYSLVLFTDEITGKKFAAITYHWLFATPEPGSWNTSQAHMVNKAVDESRTMRELINHLEDADGFEDLTGELKRYVGLSVTGPVYTIGDHFGQNIPFQLQGFSGAEVTHRWTDGKKASIKIPVVEEGYGDQLKSVIFKNTAAYINDKHPSQQLSVSLNDIKVADFQFNLNSPSQTIEIPIPPGLTGEAVITFDMPNAISPQKLGLSADPRELGISFGEMDTSYRTKSIAAISHHLGQSEPYAMQGFSVAEGTHRWTDGNKASIQIPIVQGTDRVKSVSFKHLSAFGNQEYDQQQLLVFLNGEKIIDRWVYDGDEYEIKVPIPSDLTGDAIITFEMPDAVSPKELGMSEDARKLGISFQDMEITFNAKSS